MKFVLRFCLVACLKSSFAIADESQAVDTTYIKASKELPKVLYVVPWKDLQARKDNEEKLVLHDLFGDLYEPVLPNELATLDTNPN